MPHPFHNGPEYPLQTSRFPSTLRSCVLEEPNLLIESRRDVNAIKRHGRAILTEEQAQIIFRHKPTAFSQDREKAGVLARMFGVSIKTVRDVWVGRTWYRATFHMDHTKPFEPERLEKKAGRPKGAKDSKPRPRKPHSERERAEHVSERLVPACQATCRQRLDAGLRNASDRALPVSNPNIFFGNADRRSWTDFPISIASGGFEDPFREDWEVALEINKNIIETDACGWSGAIEDGAIEAEQNFTADDNASHHECLGSWESSLLQMFGHGVAKNECPFM